MRIKSCKSLGYNIEIYTLQEHLDLFYLRNIINTLNNKIMITEDYVSFEIAKLLKEKGFNEPCYSSYKKGVFSLDSYMMTNTEFNCNAMSAPILQMAMKYLREVHNLHCAVDYDFVLGWYCQITSLKETVEYDYEEMKHYHPDKNNGFSSPEEAYEAAIKYCLTNLI